MVYKTAQTAQESFITRLYRQKNKSGFIKAFSESPMDQTVVTDVNDKDNFNNLGTTWIDTLKKGDEVRLKVGLGSVSGYLAWWGVRIFAD